jgi:hypothetical protein
VSSVSCVCSSGPTAVSLSENWLNNLWVLCMFRCLSRLPVAVGGNPAHFDLVIAKEQKGGHWLVLHLGELVALAYQVRIVFMTQVKC